ncbi:MAG: Clp protease ClpP [Microscillaceae bacterium]|nr:Clp protease ClpP [Microscillaceae bacterium]
MFEVIAKSNKESDIMMYGSIHEWSEVSSKRIVSVLNDLAKKYDVINARIHSPGGVAFEADAIGSNISRLISQGKTVNAYVDGIAASAMADLTTYFSKVFIAKSGKMMIHQARASAAGGTANQLRNAAELVDSINEGMAERFAAKTGKDKDWIMKNWMSEGQDKWFSASQALKEGLVDDIVLDSRKVPEQVESNNYLEVIAQYDEIFKPEAIAQVKQKSNPMKDRFISLLGFLGVSIALIKADAGDDDVFALLEEKTKKLYADYQGLRGSLKDAELAQVNALIEEKKLPNAQAEKFRAMVDSIGAAAVIDLLNTFDTPRNLHAEIQDNKKNSKKTEADNVNRKDWKYSDWEKNDPSGLRYMKHNDSERFESLFNAEYGE